MLRCAEDDLAAFEVLVDRHHPHALAFAWHLSGDREIALDAVQESFLRLLRSARRYEERGMFQSYLFRIVRNSVRELARARTRRREEPLESLEGITSGRAVPEGPAAPLRPDEVLASREQQARLMSAVRALPQEMRAVFVLSEIEGLSYREIAAACRCPEGTVASRKHAAVEKLRSLLGEDP